MLVIIILSTLLIPVLSSLQITDHTEMPCSGIDKTLESLKWDNRVLVIFSPHTEDDTYQSQINEFNSHTAGLDDRDLVLFSIFDDECSRFEGEILSDASSRAIRERIAPDEDAFSVYLIGKDGGIKLEQNDMLSAEKLFRVIDRMPMRQREMRDGEGDG